MTTRPTVSVCVPTYNSASTIERCIESILAQDGVDFEVLVVDDASADESAAIARSMLRDGDRVVVNDTRLGLVGNHNRCIELATGTYVQFVHADDFLLPGALQTLVRQLDQTNGGMAFAPRRVISEDAKWVKRYGRLHSRLRNLNSSNDGSSLAMQMALNGIHANRVGEPTCVMFRRQLAIDAGGFRDDIYQLMDLDMWLRLMVRSTVCFHPEELSVRHHLATTATSDNKRLRRDWLDQLRVLATVAVDAQAPARVRSVCRLWWFLIWPRVMVEAVALGSHRWTRAKLAVSAPVREFDSARSAFHRFR